MTNKMVNKMITEEMNEKKTKKVAKQNSDICQKCRIYNFTGWMTARVGTVNVAQLRMIWYDFMWYSYILYDIVTLWLASNFSLVKCLLLSIVLYTFDMCDMLIFEIL